MQYFLNRTCIPLNGSLSTSRFGREQRSKATQVRKALAQAVNQNHRSGYNAKLWIEVGVRSVAYPPV